MREGKRLSSLSRHQVYITTYSIISDKRVPLRSNYAGSGLKELTLGAALIDFQGSVRGHSSLSHATPLEFIIQVKS